MSPLNINGNKSCTSGPKQLPDRSDSAMLQLKGGAAYIDNGSDWDYNDDVRKDMGRDNTTNCDSERGRLSG